MLKTFRLRRLFGAIAAILGVAALGLAQTSELPPGACKIEDAGWVTADGGCKDLVANKVWSSNYYDTMKIMSTWDQATNWCNTKAEGGYSDWRLPSPAEITVAFQHNAAPHLNTTYLLYRMDEQASGKESLCREIDRRVDLACREVERLSSILRTTVKQWPDFNEP